MQSNYFQKQPVPHPLSYATHFKSEVTSWKAVAKIFSSHYIVDGNFLISMFLRIIFSEKKWGNIYTIKDIILKSQVNLLIILHFNVLSNIKHCGKDFRDVLANLTKLKTFKMTDIKDTNYFLFWIGKFKFYLYNHRQWNTDKHNNKYGGLRLKF